jgi:hypothetical protein
MLECVAAHGPIAASVDHQPGGAVDADAEDPVGRFATKQPKRLGRAIVSPTTSSSRAVLS